MFIYIAGTVLRMFQNAFGDSTWAKGLHNYLTTMQYESGKPADLYSGIQMAVNQDWPTNTPNVAAIMGSWELQSGFPYVHVMRQENNLVFEQNRFMYSDRNSNNLWWIPISYRVVGNAEIDQNTTADFWIPGTRQATLDGTTASRRFTSSDLVIINYQQSGYYRVNYDIGMWNELIEVINNPEKLSQIHLLNRAQLIDDSFHFGRANLLKFDVMMGLMNYLEHETDYIPWVSANRANNLLSRWLAGTEIFPHYQEFMKKNVEALFIRLGVDVIDNEPRVDRYARTIAMNVACSMKHEACLTPTLNKLITHLDEDTLPHPDVASPIYCNGMRSASMETYMKLLERANSLPSSTMKNIILSGIGCSNNFAIIEHFMNFSLESDTLTASERQRILLSTINNGEDAIDALIAFIFANYERISNFGLLRSLLSNISDRIVTKKTLDAFFVDIDMYLELDLISEQSHASFETRAEVILNWQKANLNSFNTFFQVTTETPPTTEITTETATETSTTSETSTATETESTSTSSSTTSSTSSSTSSSTTSSTTTSSGSTTTSETTTTSDAQTTSTASQSSSSSSSTETTPTTTSTTTTTTDDSSLNIASLTVLLLSLSFKFLM